MQIEIRACLEENGEVVWVSESRAEFFAVYWGGTGKNGMGGRFRVLYKRFEGS